MQIWRHFHAQVNIYAHTNSRASAPTQGLLIEWQSHYAKRLAPWDFLTNMHTHLVFLCFFISLMRSLAPSQTHSVSFQTGYITRSLNLIIHKWALFYSRAHLRTRSADVQHHCYTVSQQKCKQLNTLPFTRLQSHMAGVTSILPGNNNISS